MHHTLRPCAGSNGKQTAITAKTPNNAAHTKTGTEVEVLPKVAITTDMIPMKRLKAMAVPFPVAR